MRKNTEFRNFEITELRFSEDEGKFVEGYAIVFDSDSVDMGFIERVAPSAVDRSLREAAAGETNIHALWSHNRAIPLGSTKSGKLVLNKDSKGLRFRIDSERLTREQLAAVRDGDMQMSFGFNTRDDHWERRGDKDYRTLLDIDVSEVSLVAAPAYQDTSAAVRSLDEWRSANPPEPPAEAEPAPEEIPDPAAAPVTRAAQTKARLKMGLDLKVRSTR
ncbi:HK97 family phage prohead protease [Pararhizobium sp. BT-229]|uniref:HK97 family phage prohead protease n=1 Tax=Pararhizobium sp. BT-229 TaxID=2986923 RepID=UPI0021F6EE73|nr:HK97 family phage prohead protease [Pararhizobium sp. BT-229]MCV9965728.1 HK97 family phage prohead protease [Pararhizobium sp. BT-229]